MFNYYVLGIWLDDVERKRWKEGMGILLYLCIIKYDSYVGFLVWSSHGNRFLPFPFTNEDLGSERFRDLHREHSL